MGNLRGMSTIMSEFPCDPPHSQVGNPCSRRFWGILFTYHSLKIRQLWNVDFSDIPCQKTTNWIKRIFSLIANQRAIGDRFWHWNFYHNIFNLQKYLMELYYTFVRIIMHRIHLYLWSYFSFPNALIPYGPLG